MGCHIRNLRIRGRRIRNRRIRGQSTTGKASSRNRSTAIDTQNNMVNGNRPSTANCMPSPQDNIRMSFHIQSICDVGVQTRLRLVW